MDSPAPPFSDTAALLAIIEEIRALPALPPTTFDRILRRHCRGRHGTFTKSDIIRAYRRWSPQQDWSDEEGFLTKLRRKPMRTQSGVTPVTVLTRPFPCPGQCIFCPNDVAMPKSYLSMEPGAQRAFQNRFDPYRQTAQRLRAYFHNGHPLDKVELIVLGGTWTAYPDDYQRWFLSRCFAALNEFDAAAAVATADSPGARQPYAGNALDGRALTRRYNEVVGRGADRAEAAAETATWDQLHALQRRNEGAAVRCVGLSLETRPDEVTPASALHLRRLGATKIQLGYQSLSDRVLAMNRRGHTTAASAAATRHLRELGFKIQAHWMPNLHGSDPAADVEDYRRLFDDPGLRPDELKIYPCSLIESAELMREYEAGRWRPYADDELRHVLSECLARTPEYCRITRVVRDIPSTDILVGNKTNNLREQIEDSLRRQGRPCRDIRSRQMRGPVTDPAALTLKAASYATAVGHEQFLQFVTADDELVAFLRLSLPARPVAPAEIRHSAMLREVHVYGTVASLGEHRPGKPQHLGLGRRLIEAAASRARNAGFTDLAVISAVGTRPYYRRQGFRDGELYQHLALGSEEVT